MYVMPVQFTPAPPFFIGEKLVGSTYPSIMVIFTLTKHHLQIESGPWDPFYKHGLILIPVWTSYYIRYKVWVRYLSIWTSVAVGILHGRQK